MQQAAKAKRPAIATVKEVEALKPEAKEYAVKDAKTEGLWLMVKSSGVKSWVFFYSFAGRQRKLTVGQVALADARKKAAEARILIAEAMDPATAKRAYKAAQTAQAIQKRPTSALIEGTATRECETPMNGGASLALGHVHDRVEDVVARFVEEYAKVKTRDWKETARLLDKNVVSPWRGRRLSELGPDDFYSLLDGIAERAPIGANRVHAQLSVMCRWASGRKVKLLDRNPFIGVEKVTDEKGRSRERVLSDDEIRFVWLASDSLGFPFGPMVKLLLLTGARRDEVAHLSWDEIDMAKAEWAVPGSRTKNRRPYIVPLSGAALDVLRSLPRFERRPGQIDYALSPGTTPPSGFSAAKARLDKIILALLRAGDPNAGPLAQWQFHDCRRSFVTNLARLGVSPVIREACVNHISGHKSGVAGVYDRWEYLDEKRVAFRLLADHINSIVSADVASASKNVELETV